MDPLSGAASPPTDRMGPATLMAAGCLALIVAFSAPYQIGTLGALPMRAVVVVLFLASMSLLLALRAMFLARRRPDALRPALGAALSGALSLVGAALLAYVERNSVLDAGPIGRSLEPALVAWEHGQAAAMSRDIALMGLTALPGLALALTVLSRTLARRKAAKVAAAAGEAGTPAVGARRKAIAAGWGAFLLAGALGALGLSLDALAILAPVDAPPHPRLVHLTAVQEQLAKANLPEACAELEAALGGGTPKPLVLKALPGVEEIAHRCIGHAIERLPKGPACADQAAKLAGSPTVRFVAAEARAERACDGASEPGE